jgi:superfamily I DNA and/or RNA helicase
LASYLKAAGKIVGTERLPDISALQAEWIERTKGVDEFQLQLLTEARVIAGTCLGFASNKIAAELEYDWVIVDEAGRASPPEILVPMIRGRRFVLVGDHRQLPPILDDRVSARVVERLGIERELLECSLFQDLVEGAPKEAKMSLVKQYRMHPVIGSLISSVFYGGNLDHAVDANDRPWGTRLLGAPLRWINTSADPRNSEARTGFSFSNKLEAEIIRSELNALNATAGKTELRPTVGVLAGYAAQISLLETELRSHKHQYPNISLSVLTVDAAQGKEFDFVYYSAVRSNTRGTIGFLRDVRRLNVAFSRGREALTIVGNKDSLSGTSLPGGGNPFPLVVQYFEKDSTVSPIFSNRT